MRYEHLKYLACPACKADLVVGDVRAEQGGRIAHGSLRCTACDGQYPIERFIPRFVSSDNYARGFGLQWTIHARTQYDSYSGVPISENRFFDETGWDRHLEGELVLEVGGGAGRFTEQVLKTGAMVVSLEYSLAADANYAANGQADNLLIVQADLYRMPFRAAQFDRLFCLGVLQHTPDVERAFRVLPTVLRPGGCLVIDVYEKPAGFKRLSATRYWVRPITRRLAPRLLYRLVRGYVTLAWPLARWVGRIPRFGKKLNWLFLIADYHGVYPLSDGMLREWAVLDTFDVLSPTYDSPQTLATVRHWFTAAGLEEVDVCRGYNGIQGRGRKGNGNVLQRKVD